MRLIGKAPPSTDGVRRSIATRGAFRASASARSLRRARSATGFVRVTDSRRTSPGSSGASMSPSPSGFGSPNAPPAKAPADRARRRAARLVAGVDENQPAALRRCGHRRCRHCRIAETAAPAPVRLRISPPMPDSSLAQRVRRVDVLAQIEAALDPVARKIPPARAAPRGPSGARAPNSKPIGTSSPCAGRGSERAAIGDSRLQSRRRLRRGYRAASRSSNGASTTPTTAGAMRRSRLCSSTNQCARRSHHGVEAKTASSPAPSRPDRRGHGTPGVQPTNRHDPHSRRTASITAFTKRGGTSASPSSRKPGRAGIREPDDAIGPPCEKLVFPVGQIEACRDRLRAKLRLARIDHVRPGTAMEPVLRGTRHRAVGRDPIQNQIENKIQSGVAACAREILRGRVRVLPVLDGRVGAFKIVGEKDVAARRRSEDRRHASMGKAHVPRARDMTRPLLQRSRAQRMNVINLHRARRRVPARRQEPRIRLLWNGI